MFFKKVLIFAQGFEGIEGKIQTFLTKNILKLVDLITVRDEKSSFKLKEIGIKSVVLADPVYSLANNIEINNCDTAFPVYPK